jgi:hypothetical protein
MIPKFFQNLDDAIKKSKQARTKIKTEFLKKNLTHHHQEGRSSKDKE